MAQQDIRNPLPDDVRQKLRAIVFDTNSFPGGQLRLSVLEEWGRLAALAELEVWLPEPVLWELAEHAAAVWEEHRASVRRNTKVMSAAGLAVPADSTYQSRLEVFDAVEQRVRALGTALRILPLDGPVAREALRDQVLQLQPAKKKDGVKTGAADSAWLRQVLAEAGNDPGRFVIVGSDADVYRAFEQWQLDKPVMVPLHVLESVLFTLEAPEADIVQKITKFLLGLTDAPLETGTDPDGTLTIGDVKDTTRLGDGWWDQFQVVDISILKLQTLIGMNEIKINRMTGVVTAQVFFGPLVEYSGWSLDVDGETRSRSGIIPDMVLRDTFSFFIRDGAVARAESTSGQAAAFSDEGAFHDPDQAFEEFRDALLLVPGVAQDPVLVEAIGALAVGADEIIGSLNGYSLTVSAGEYDGGWAASLELEKDGSRQELEVRCELDVSRNPYEMPDLFPGWVVFTDAEISHRVPGEWAAPAWVIERVWGV